MIRSIKLPRQPRILLLGRTNVGKSTFWKRMTSQAALISRLPHTTRDVKIADVAWRDKTFQIIDTAGCDIPTAEDIGAQAAKRIEAELTRADMVLFMIDQTVLSTIEEFWLKKLRTLRKPVLVILNKCDRAVHRKNVSIASLKGFPVFAVSSISGGGVGDVLDEISESIAASAIEKPEPHLRFGLVGRTNVGKSSLFNALMQSQRAIVSPQHHTTRESLTANTRYNQMEIELTDTAGIIRRQKDLLSRDTQKLTERTIDHADVCALIVESNIQSLPKEDIKLAYHIVESGKSLMVIVNKWDLVANKSDSTERKLKQEIRSAIRGLPYVPLILASATTQVGISRILETALQIFHERYVELDSESLKFICKSLGPDILKVKQHGQNPPRFFAQSALKSVPVAYPAIVEKAIRRRYPFLGTPLIISVNKKIRHYVPNR